MQTDVSQRRRGLMRLVVFAASALMAAAAVGQTEAAEAPPATAAASVAASAAPAAASAVPACPACPAPSADALAARLDALTRAVEAAASAPPPGDRWQDAKAVVLNVLSSRIDHWLFGGAAGSPGLVAQIVAFVAFVLSAVKLTLAWAQLKPAPRPGPWGRLRNWAREHKVARWINLVLAGAMLLISAAALYVVMSARADADGVRRSLDTLDTALQACHTELAAERARPPADGRVAGVPAPAPVLAPEALERLSASCDRAIAATNERVEQVRQTAEDIASRQPWAITKLLAFGAMLFLLAFAIRKW